MGRVRMTVVVALAVAMSVVLAGPAPATGPAGDGPAVDAPLDPAVVHLARLRGIAIEDAADRVARQDAVIAGSAGLRDVAEFGGLWIDETDRVVVAATTEAGRADQRRTLGGLADDVTFVLVDHSAADLDRAADRLAALVRTVPDADAPGVSSHLDIRRNRVVLTLPRDATRRARLAPLARAARAELGHLLTVVETGVAADPLACSWPNCDPPLRGATRLHLQGTTPGGGATASSCTSAFVARSVFDNKLYVLTAGHCTAPYQDVRARTASGTLVTVGVTHNEHVGQYGDVGIARVTNEAFWGSAPWVVVLPSVGPPATTADDQYDIDSETASVVGQVVCKTGNTTGTTCGPITETGASVHYPDWGWVSNLGIADLHSNPGDSGSPFYKSHKAYGILSGGDQRGTLYSGIGIAEAVLNVEVSN